MATRCTIIVEGIDSVKVYKHWDGYPEATLEWLQDFNEDFEYVLHKDGRVSFKLI